MRLSLFLFVIAFLNATLGQSSILSDGERKKLERAALNHAFAVRAEPEGIGKSGIFRTSYHHNELKISHSFKAFMYHKGPIPFFEDSALGDIKKSWSKELHELGVQAREKGEFHQIEEELKLAFSHIESIRWSRVGLDSVTTIPSPVRVRGVLIQRLLVALLIAKKWPVEDVDSYRLVNSIILNIAVMSKNQAELRGMFEWCYAFSDKDEKKSFLFWSKTSITPVPGFGQAMMVLYEVARFMGIPPVKINEFFNKLHEKVKEGQMNSDVAKRFMELYKRCNITDLMTHHLEISHWLATGCSFDDNRPAIANILQRQLINNVDI